MAKSNWELELRQLVVNMDPGKRQELFDAMTAFKAPQQVRALPPADQIKAWVKKNGPLATALGAELDKGVTFGLTGGQRDDVRGVIREINTAYRYAVGDWRTGDPNDIVYANDSIRSAQALPGYTRFQELSQHIFSNQEQYAKQVRSAGQAAANKEKQQKEKEAREARQQKIRAANKSFPDQLYKRSEAVEEEVVCLLIAPSGKQYQASHLTFLTDSDTHPIAQKISEMDALDHSIKSCAEFKAINTYLRNELKNESELAKVLPGGHTIAYVYKKRGLGLEPKSKAACTNCNNWLTELGWTSEPGDF